MSVFQAVSAASVLLLAAGTMIATVSAEVSSYVFAYGVNDPVTGDIKDQQEVKNGEQVYGYYRLLDADGLVRTVNYQSNPLTGFQAQVSRDAPVVGVAPGPVAIGRPVVDAIVPETKEINYLTHTPSMTYADDGSLIVDHSATAYAKPTSYQRGFGLNPYAAYAGR